MQIGKKIILGMVLLLVTSTCVWAMSYEDAKLQNKPIVIMFHMHGCGACRKFSSRFDDLSGKFSNKFNFVKEDVNSSQIATTLGSRFETVPAFFIMQPKTQNATRISDDCAWDKECFAKTLQEYGQ